jgi:hypothetical protein
MSLLRSAPALAAAGLALAFAGSALAGGPAVFADPEGDTGGPDVTRSTVDNDRQSLSIALRLANRPSRPTEDIYTVFVDADRSAATGDSEHHGADVLVAVTSGGGGLQARVARWQGGTWTAPALREGVSVAWDAPSLRIRGALGPLGVAGRVVRLSVVAVWEGIYPDANTDYAPDDPQRPYVYTLREDAPGARAPETLIRRGPRGPTRKRVAVFRFVSTEPGSTFRCKLDRRPWRTCRSPRSYGRLARGRHVFRVAARDRDGNLDPTPAVRAWRIR